MSTYLDLLKRRLEEVNKDIEKAELKEEYDRLHPRPPKKDAETIAPIECDDCGCTVFKCAWGDWCLILVCVSCGSEKREDIG